MGLTLYRRATKKSFAACAFAFLHKMKIRDVPFTVFSLTGKTTNVDTPADGEASAFLNDEFEARSNTQVMISSPENIAILSVYFVQGALGLSRLAVSYFMKDELRISPSYMAAITGLMTIPWVIKPLYGFLSDGVPIFGYKRRSYLILSGFLGCLSWLYLGLLSSGATSSIVSFVLGSASVAISDVVVDSIVVERSRAAKKISPPSSVENLSYHGTTEARYQDSAENRVLEQIPNDSTRTAENEGIASADSGSSMSGGDLQSLCWSASAVGGILSAYFSGSLLQTVPARTVFLITAIFPLIISIAAFFINEPHASSLASFQEFKSDVSVKLSQLTGALTSPRIYLPVFFVFAWQSTPSSGAAMFYFFTNELNFQPEFMGRVSLAHNIASLVGVLVYRAWLKNVPIKTIIIWTTIISTVVGLTPVLLVTHLNRSLGIPDQLFSLSDTVVLTILGQLSFMPVLVYAASLCPPGIEGTLFATLMSIYNVSGVFSSELGALLTKLLGVSDRNFSNLALLITMCSLSSLLPLPFIGLLDKSKPRGDDDQNRSNDY